MENWKTAFELSDRIEVSDMGRVRMRKYDGTYKVMHLAPSGRYLSVCYANQQPLVHRLVAKLFLPEPKENKNVIIHINGNYHDNRASNLKWSTKGEVIASTYTSKSRKRPFIHCIEKDLTFTTVYSAAAALQLPREIIAYSIDKGESVFGLTFEYVNRIEGAINYGKLNVIEDSKKFKSLDSYRKHMKTFLSKPNTDLNK